MPTSPPIIRWATASLLAAAVLAAPALAADDAKTQLARDAEAILKANCYRCHGENGTNEGGFNYLMDRERLVSSKKLVPEQPDKSKLMRRITDGDMPPIEEKVRPSEGDIATLKKWIAAGAPAFKAAAERTPVTPADVIDLMKVDLDKTPERDRRFIRYFTLAHLYTAGRSEDELESYRVSLSKLVNSLSWGRQVIPPKPIGPTKTVLRIDLRDYKWNEKVWDEILFNYPYGVRLDTAAEKAVRESTQVRLAAVRADWFVFAASRPPLYHDVLQLPKTDRELEKMLQVDAAENIRQERVARAGFNGSGVSRNNRMIERHESAYGAYWKSYDFGGNSGRKNLFARPNGPGDADNTFEHDGGELIFNLPNGLQAYLLIDGKGERIDKGPVEIVSDPKQADRRVVNGVSCMSCHSKGMIPKDDQVRGHVEKNAAGFAKEDAATALALYPAKEAFAKLIQEDAERFQKAVAKTGAPLSATEPVVALAQRYEVELDLAAAASEVGLPPPEFVTRLKTSAEMSRLVGGLTTDGGTVQRDAWENLFPVLVEVGLRGIAVPRHRRQITGTFPADAPTSKRPQNVVTLTLNLPPKVGTQVDSEQKLRVETFYDRERKHYIYLAENGLVSVVPLDKEPNLDRGVTHHRTISPPVRTTGDKEVKINVSWKTDDMTGCLLVVTEGYGFAAVKIGDFETKGNTSGRFYQFHVRRAGVEELTGNGLRYVRSTYHFDDAGLLLSCEANGYVELSTTNKQRLASDSKMTPNDHGFVVKARAENETHFQDKTKAFGIELEQDLDLGILKYHCETGTVALLPGKLKPGPTLAPTWSHRFKLGVRKKDQDKLADEDLKVSVEVYRDENTGNFIYVTETGHIAVAPPVK